jgi:serine protease 27
LQLKKPIQFNEHIQPLCLSTDNSPNFLDIGRVSGWGLTHENFNVGIKPNILQTADVPVWENDECQNSYRELNKPHRITENQICAGGRDGGVDSCWMDSGGPLISKTNGNLIGIVSTGVGCARKGLPGIYTRMSKYTKWISSHVK